METIMVSREDIEGFLIRMDLDYEEVDEGMFLTRVEAGGAPVVVHYADALLLIRMKVMDMPAEDSPKLFRKLLELNSSEIVHGAYGIENGDLILSDTLELETLGFYGLQASMDSLTLAAASHMEQIRTLENQGLED